MSDSTDDLVLLAAFGIAGYMVYQFFTNPPKSAGASAAMVTGASSLPNAAVPYAQSPVANTSVFGPLSNTGTDYSDFDSGN
jgi:hypothetical protein